MNRGNGSGIIIKIVKKVENGVGTDQDVNGELGVHMEVGVGDITV